MEGVRGGEGKVKGKTEKVLGDGSGQGSPRSTPGRSAPSPWSLVPARPTHPGQCDRGGGPGRWAGPAPPEPTILAPSGRPWGALPTPYPCPTSHPGPLCLRCRPTRNLTQSPGTESRRLKSELPGDSPKPSFLGDAICVLLPARPALSSLDFRFPSDPAQEQTPVFKSTGHMTRSSVRPVSR